MEVKNIISWDNVDFNMGQSDNMLNKDGDILDNILALENVYHEPLDDDEEDDYGFGGMHKLNSFSLESKNSEKNVLDWCSDLFHGNVAPNGAISRATTELNKEEPPPPFPTYLPNFEEEVENILLSACEKRFAGKPLNTLKRKVSRTASVLKMVMQKSQPKARHEEEADVSGPVSNKNKKKGQEWMKSFEHALQTNTNKPVERKKKSTQKNAEIKDLEKFKSLKVSGKDKDTNKKKTKTKGKPRKHSSQYRGVSLCSKDGRWQARIRVGSKVKYLGRFKSEIEAAKCYDAAAFEHHGIRAVPNFPQR